MNSKTLIIGIGCFVLYSFFAIPFAVVAQEVTPSPQPHTFCFSVIACRDPKAKCKTTYLGHSAKLTVEPGKGPPPNSTVYVIESIDTGNGTYYTTGFPKAGITLGYAPIPDNFAYIFKGLHEEDTMTSINQDVNPLKSNAAGELTTTDGARVSALEWTDVTDVSNKGGRRFFGVSIGGDSPPPPTAPPIPSVTPLNGSVGGQQLSQLQFQASPSTFPGQGSDDPNSCTKITWDPDGRIFDSQSLEPIPDVSVTLSKKRSSGLFSFVNKFNPDDVPDGLLSNPYFTKEDGYFSFYVPDGTYKLVPSTSKYNFPSSLTLNKNYIYMYSDIYPAMTGVEIVEKGGPQRRDIPVDPIDGKPSYYPIKIMEYGYQSNRLSTVYIDGRVSHPLATIKAYSVIPDSAHPDLKKQYRLIQTVQTDKQGRFSLAIDQSLFDTNKNETFGEIEAIKVNFDTKSVNTNESPALLKLEPIPSYIEGYAMKDGKILPGAKVELVYDHAILAYYQTMADIHGYFKIPSEYISFIPYTLRYTSGNIITDVSTSSFIIDNNAYIRANNIDLFSPQYNNSQRAKSTKKQTTSQNGRLNSSLSDSVNRPTPSNTINTQKNLVIMGVVVLIIGLLIAAIYIAVLLIRKNQGANNV